MTRQLKLIAGARVLEAARWARENLYALLVLAPLVLGMTYFGVGRMVREADWSPSEAQTLAAALAAAACLVALSLSRASVEIYHVRSPEWVLDALPVSASSQLAAALLWRVVHTSVAAAAALVLRWLNGGAFDVVVFGSALLLACVLASGEVLSALLWVHWSHRRAGARRGSEKATHGVSETATGGLFEALTYAVLTAVSLAACAGAGGLLLASVVRPGGLTLVSRAAALACGALTAVVLAAFAFVLHERWRAADAEFATRLGVRERWGSFVEALAGRVSRGRRAVASQLARDLRLVLRGFSSAVYAAWGVSALVVLLLVALLAGGVVPLGEAEGLASATWLPRVVAVKFACVLACVASAAPLPVLVAHQRPHLWLERAVGVQGEDAWRAKLYLARVVTLPAALAAWGAGVACGASPAAYVLPLLAECVWLWWIVSTVAGGLAFEMPEQPGLALILVLCAALAAGGLTAFVWPAGLAIYGMGVQPLCLRGVARAQLHLKGEGT
ncbi:MAG TPA: hypothetical protein VJ866_05315 [Pyrinomonadaceae bacterium]|nr:hypothetical protein [Pyrinomonadaceae bacterium]